MSTQDEFLREIRDGLMHLYDYVRLENLPLAVRYWPEVNQAGDRGQRLHRLLLETIEELHSPTAKSRDTPAGRAYYLLVYRYVEQWPLSDIVQELGYSRRQFFREQRKALAMLAASLWEKIPQQATKQQPSQSTNSDDLLAAEVGRVLTHRAVVDLGEVARGVLAAVGRLAEQHSVMVTYDMSRTLPTVQGNRTLLRQVCLKALSTVITYPGTKRVHFRMYPKAHRVTIELLGEGPPPLLTEDEAPRWAAELDFVHRLVEIVGGQSQAVEVGSEGYTWRLDLPLGEERILMVVEDNDAVILAFRRYLVGHNYQVIGATTGAEALRLARELDPAAITLDVMMPSQDGWEILQALKNDPVTQHIPVIICSVLDDPDLAHSLGAAAYLCKPIAQADLVATLDGLLGAF